MPHFLHPTHRTLALALGGTAGVLLLAAGPASAHVTVSPSAAEAGSSTELTFRVPNEEADAATDEVSVLIPTEHPIAQVLVKPVAGWTVTRKTQHLTTPLVTDDGKFTSVVSQITWKGGRIQPGQYQDFAVSVDPLPDTPTDLVFKTVQTYTDGDVVRWIDLQQPGQDEPEHPAPTLTLTAATSPEGTPTDASSTPSVTASLVRAESSTGSSTWPGVVAVVSLALAAAALALAGVGLRRRRSV